MSPDTQQNLAYTIYFLIAHNWEVMLYVAGLAIASYMAIRIPTRGKVLLMLGCGFLIFAFQYNKHIVEPLLEQTRTSLITERQSFRIEHVLEVTLMKIVPFSLPVIGWSLVAGGAYLEWRSKKGGTIIDEHKRSS